MNRRKAIKFSRISGNKKCRGMLVILRQRSLQGAADEDFLYRR